MASSYLIPDGNSCHETIIRKSRFVCQLAHAATVEQAKAFIAEVRNKHSDATHHCWAFQTEEPGSSRSIGCSDDGEPYGTAGKPMLNVLSYADVGEVVAVVSRYYGGVKLGASGLVRAYGNAVKSNLSILTKCEKKHWFIKRLIFDR